MRATLHRRPEDLLTAVAVPGERIVLLGLDELDEEAWAVLTAVPLELVRVPDAGAAQRALADGQAQVAIADVRVGAELARAARARPELAGAHVVLCVRVGSQHNLREALDAGADDVMRV